MIPTHFRDIFGVTLGNRMEGEDGEEWRKLPCEDRIAHKVGVALLDILTLLRKGRI